jgi:hypothetical protein
MLLQFFEAGSRSQAKIQEILPRSIRDARLLQRFEDLTISRRILFDLKYLAWTGLDSMFGGHVDIVPKILQ